MSSAIEKMAFLNSSSVIGSAGVAIASISKNQGSCLARGGPAQGSGALHDGEAAPAIDQVNQAARIDGDIVARDPIRSRRGIGNERGHLAHGARIADVDDAQTVRKPGARDLSAGDLFYRLVTGGHGWLRLALDAIDLE